MKSGRYVPLVLVLSCCQAAMAAQQDHGAAVEQSDFYMEQNAPDQSVRRPLTIPASVLRILRDDKSVVACLKHEKISSEQVPASWFIASEIHLSMRSEGDLIVLPNLAVKHNPDEIAPNACLLGVSTGQFWIFRNIKGEYHQVLSVASSSLDILRTRSHNLRDILIGMDVEAGHRSIKVFFEFDGRTYQQRTTIVDDDTGANP